MVSIGAGATFSLYSNGDSGENGGNSFRRYRNPAWIGTSQTGYQTPTNVVTFTLTTNTNTRKKAWPFPFVGP